jgi:PAS domain S-box-containing protein
VPKSLTVLLVEDSESDAALTLRSLNRQGFEVSSQRVDSEADFRKSLQGGPWDVVIADYILPTFSGLEALKILTEKGLDIPCIITSGRIDDETAVAAMKAGARDYVMKDNLKRLGPTVERELAEAEIRRKSREAVETKKRTEEKLDESQQRLALAVEASGGGVFEYSGGPVPDYFFDQTLSRITGFALAELPRSDRFLYWLASQIHPEDLNTVLDVYERFLAEPQKRYSVEFRFKHKSGQWIYVRCIARGTKTGPEASGVRLNGIILDITDSKQIERRVLLVNKILQLYWEVSSREEYLEKAVSYLHEWTGCEALGIRILNREDGTIPYASQVGFSQEFLSTENRLSLSTDECACIRVVANRLEPQDIIALTPGGSFSLANSLSFISNLEPGRQARFRGVCVRSGFQTIAVIAIRYKEDILGAIHIADKNAAALSGLEIETLESIASIIGQGIYRFEISDTLKKAEDRLRHLSRRLVEVQENEKRNLSRELHDEIGQSLTALKILVGQALRVPSGENLESLRDAYAVVSDLMQQVRDMSLDLRPSMLDDLGLLPALFWQFERFSNQTGIKIKFEHQGFVDSLPVELNTTAFRVIQEAITNIVRHSGVSEASVWISVTDNLLSIIIEDRGRGFNFGELDAKNSAGISGMRERVLLMEGKLNLISAPGAGTRVEVEIPLPVSK